MNNQKNVWLLIVLAVALGGAGYFGYRYLNPPSVIADEYEANGVCLACKQQVNVRHALMDTAPFLCPACGEKAMFKWMRCAECNYRFIPQPILSEIDGAPALPMTPQCYHCGCTSVEYIIPGFDMYTPIGDAELPAWPPDPNGKPKNFKKKR